MKKALLGCIVVAIFLLSRYPGERRIVLSKEGFVPQIVTVITQNTITVSLKRSQASQISIYNAQRVRLDSHLFTRGMTYAFLLPADGIYYLTVDDSPRYSPEVGMVIRTQGNELAAVKDVCDSSKAQQVMENVGENLCTEFQLRKELETTSVKGIMEHVIERYKQDQPFALHCNDYTRRIGAVAYKTHAHIDNLINSQDVSFCNYGFLIGYLDALFASGGSNKDALQFCDTVKKSPDASAHSYMECLKGYGQGYIPHYTFSSSQTLAKDLKKSTGACDGVTKDANERNICVVGIMSGVAVDFDKEARQKALEAQKETKQMQLFQHPLDVCLSAPVNYQPQCYGSMGGMLIYSGRDTMASALEKVLTIPNTDSQIRATRIIAKIVYNNDPANRISHMEECRNLPKHLRWQCFISLVQGSMELGTPGSEYESGFTFCRNSQLTREEESLCVGFVLYQVDEVLGGKDGVARICSMIEPQWKPHCSTYKQDYFQL